MRNINLTDTIAAIATAVGQAGIGIVRISGKEALAIADKIFRAKDGTKPANFKTYTVHYGWIVNRGETSATLVESNSYIEKEVIIDEAILTVMRAPKSYTKEDIVEISCHGGVVAVRDTLELVLASGARLALPGEFTRRAFLNGRIDLAQAEAVLDIIKAKTDAALKIGVEQLRGALSHRINKISKGLLDLLALLEANIDFPEEEITPAALKSIRQSLSQINHQLQEILAAAKQARILRQGINVVICGKPNTGKSSLLNALLKQERSIVSSVPGTTRDTIEEVLDIKGIPVKIVDTAGVLEPRDIVEKKAVGRSRRYMELADLVILLFDGSKKLGPEDESLIRRLNKKACIAVINKIDLKQKIQKERIAKSFSYLIEISARKLKNIGGLEEIIAGLVLSGSVVTHEPEMLSNLRHIESIKKIQKSVARALNSLDNSLSLEFIAQDIKEALLYCDDILGKRFSENLLDKIFGEFCIGK